MPRLTRRTLLATSVAALAGCNALGSDGDVPEVTPAAVPQDRREVVEALTAEEPPDVGTGVVVADGHVAASRAHLARLIDRAERALDDIEAESDDATGPRAVSPLREEIGDLRAFPDRRWDDPLETLDRIRERIPEAGHSLGYALALRDGDGAEPVDPEAAIVDVRAYLADRRFACVDPGQLLVNAVVVESMLHAVLTRIEAAGIPERDGDDPAAIAERYRHRAHLRRALDDAGRLTAAGGGPESKREPFAAAIRRNRARLRRSVRVELDAVEELSETIDDDDSPVRRRVTRALVGLGDGAERDVTNSRNAAERHHDAISLFAAAHGQVRARAVRTALERLGPLADADRMSFDALERARGEAIDGVASAAARVDAPLRRRHLGAAVGAIRLADRDLRSIGRAGSGGEGDPRATAYARYRLAVAVPEHAAAAAAVATER